MARKIKFALEMADGAKVRGDLEELREHFDLESAVRYFLSGKLIEWLDDRYYESEAEALEEIDKDSPDFHQKLCEALGVEYKEDDDLDVAALERLNEKKAILRQKTDDEEIIKNADKTALTQEDLADLLDMGEKTIYLCGDTFSIPARVGGITYIGILGIPRIEARIKSRDSFREKGIVLENVLLLGEEEKKEDKNTGKTLSNGTNTYLWKIPKEQMEQLFSSTFGIYMKREISKGVREQGGADVYDIISSIRVMSSGKSIPQPLYIICDSDNKFTSVGKKKRITKAMEKAGEIPQQISSFTSEQKQLALSVVCNNQYSEDEIIHLRIQEDFSHGWAFTRDAFCATYEDERIMIPYKDLNFITERRTKYIADGKGKKWKFSTGQKCYIQPVRLNVRLETVFNEADALCRYLSTVSRMF